MERGGGLPASPGLRGHALPLPEGTVKGGRVLKAEHARNLGDIRPWRCEKLLPQFLTGGLHKEAERRALVGDAPLQGALAGAQVPGDGGKLGPAAG